MKRTAIILLSFCLLFGGAAVVLASEEAGGGEHAEGGHGETLAQTIAKWVNFAALGGLLYWLIAKSLKLPDKFKDDYQQIQHSIESARKAKEEAEKRLAELDQRMLTVGTEIEKLKSDAAREAEEEKTRILDSARREAERLLELAHKDIDTEVEIARKELRQQVAEMAVQKGSEIIHKEIEEKDQKQLMRDYIEGFGK